MLGIQADLVGRHQLVEGSLKKNKMTQNWKNKCHLIVLQGNLVVVDTQAEQDNQAGDTLAAAEGSPVQGSHLLRLEWDMVLLDYQDAMIPTLGKVGMESFISDALEQFLLMQKITPISNNDDDSGDWELLSHSVNQLIR